MERKVGEIFEYNGEWYQCMHVPQKHSCKLCDLRGLCCDNNGVKIVTCVWRHREDNTSVIFKKLEKVGEPFKSMGNCYQVYKTYCEPTNVGLGSSYDGSKVVIKIKQNKENMKEKKLNLKPFDLEAAKAGKPVCTRDGRKARIICFDAKRKDMKNIIALVPSKEYSGFEDLITYPNNGNYHGGHENDGDLMMFPQKKEGWVNVYKSDNNKYSALLGSAYVYKTKGEAELNFDEDNGLATVKIEWEE